MTSICPFISLFCWRGKRAGKNYITILPITWIVHAPFTCYQNVLNIKVLKSMNKFMTLTCQIIFTFSFDEKNEHGNSTKHVTQKPNSSRPLNSTNEFKFMILAPLPSTTNCQTLFKDISKRITPCRVFLIGQWCILTYKILAES